MSARPTLVLLPGNMCDGRMWEGHGAVLLHTLASHGWSTVRPALDADTIAAMAAGVLAGVAGPIIPVGFSMGGIVALEIARQAPERISGLVLIGTNPAADLPERAARRPAHQHKARSGKLLSMVADDLMPHYLARENDQDVQLKDLIVDMAMARGTDIFVAQSEALRTRADLSDVIPALAVPLFLACGAQDRLCYPAWHEDMAAQAPDAVLHVIEGAGHMLPLEQPKALTDALVPWLEARFR